MKTFITHIIILTLLILSFSHSAEWEPIGKIAGVNGTVYSMAIDDSNSLYVGGSFTVAGANFANSVAKWDGDEWGSIGSGVDGSVYSLVLADNGKIYIGGRFSISGNSEYSNIAEWDGTTWTSLGTGIDGTVKSIVIDANETIYAGGEFTTAGGITVNNIAKFRDGIWSSLGAGVDSTVNALQLDSEGSLYAGGEFKTANGITVNHIAKWEDSLWVALGTGFDSAVHSLHYNGNEQLIAGGTFDTVNNVWSPFLARWDALTWHTCFEDSIFDPDFIFSPHYGRQFERVKAIVPDKNNNSVIILNRYKEVDPNWGTMDFIITYPRNLSLDGLPLNSDLISSLAVDYNNNLYISKIVNNVHNGMTHIIHNSIDTIYKPLLNETGLSIMVSDDLKFSITKNGSIYLGSRYGLVHNVSESWQELSPIKNRVKSIVTTENSAFIAENINIGFPPKEHMRKYVDGQVSPHFINTMGGSQDNNSFYIHNVDSDENLYIHAGLERRTPQDNLVIRVKDTIEIIYNFGYKYANGSNYLIAIPMFSSPWDSVVAYIHDIPIYNDSVIYLCGEFPDRDTLPLNVALLKDSTLIPLKGPANGIVNSGVVDKYGHLFIAGKFDTVAGVPANKLAMWNGTDWLPLKTGTNGNISDLAVDSNGILYAAGDFDTIGGIHAKNIACWNGEQWFNVGNDLNPVVSQIKIYNDEVYVSGGFNGIGDLCTPYIAKCDIPSIPIVPIVKKVTININQLKISNNYLKLSLNEKSKVQYSIYSISGRKVLESSKEIYKAGTHSFSLPIKNFASGIYLLNVTINGKRYLDRFVHKK